MLSRLASEENVPTSALGGSLSCAVPSVQILLRTLVCSEKTIQCTEVGLATEGAATTEVCASVQCCHGTDADVRVGDGRVGKNYTSGVAASAGEGTAPLPRA